VIFVNSLCGLCTRKFKDGYSCLSEHSFVEDRTVLSVAGAGLGAGIAGIAVSECLPISVFQRVSE
jgi:hypothetical protein